MLTTNTTYNVRIDKRVKQEADALYKSMGMTLSSAINLFLTQSLIQGKLPIAEVIAEPAYADAVLRDVRETERAVREGTATVYETPDALFAAWEEEDG
jgi:DNA-damage-inducible protein J